MEKERRGKGFRVMMEEMMIIYLKLRWLSVRQVVFLPDLFSFLGE